MSIYVNRTLNLKNIQAIGFDMDYTIVRYDTQAFEQATYDNVVSKLIKNLNYPNELKNLKFEFNRAIRGLVLDQRFGNTLKISLYGRIKKAFHGTKEIEHRKQKEMYRGEVIDLNDQRFMPVDTAFSISHAVLFAQLVDLKDQNKITHDYEQIAADILEQIDLAHRDGSLKTHVLNDLDRYIIQDPLIPQTLEKLKRSGKKLFVATNSDYFYTQKLLDYAFTPHLKEHKDWRDLFELTITYASKPRFFTSRPRFLKLDPKTQQLTNVEDNIETGIYQGGNSLELQEYFNLEGDQILYLGDHIYGDVVSIKKFCQWRTALVLEELDSEVQAGHKNKERLVNVNKYMLEKEAIEDKVNKLYEEYKKNKPQIDKLFLELKKIDEKLEVNIIQYEKGFNPYWGEIMRSGAEESRLAGQVAKYACIYMTKVSDLADYSPRKYFRPKPRDMAHDL